MKNLAIPDSYYMGMFCRPTSAPSQAHTIKRKSNQKNSKIVQGHPVTVFVSNQNTNYEEQKIQKDNQKSVNLFEPCQQNNLQIVNHQNKQDKLSKNSDIQEYQHISRKLTIPMNYQVMQKKQPIAQTSYLKLKQKKDNIRKFIQARSNNNKKHDIGLQINDIKQKTNSHLNFTDMKSKLNFNRNDKKKKKQSQKNKRVTSVSPNWKHSMHIRQKLNQNSLQHHIDHSQNSQVNNIPQNRIFDNRVLCSIVSIQLEKQHIKSGKNFKAEERSREPQRYSIMTEHQRQQKSGIISKSQDIRYENETKFSFNRMMTPCNRKNSKGLQYEKGHRKTIIAHHYKALTKCKKKRAWNVRTQMDEQQKKNIGVDNHQNSANITRDISSALQPRKSSDYFMNTKTSFKKYLQFLQRDNQLKGNRYQQQDKNRKRSLTQNMNVFVPINADANVSMQAQLYASEQFVQCEGISKSLYSASLNPIKKANVQAQIQTQTQQVVYQKYQFMSVKGVKAKIVTQKQKNKIVQIQCCQKPMRKHSEKIKFNNFSKNSTTPIEFDEIIPWNQQ